MAKNKPVTIIGGMGPQATVYFYDLFVKLAIKYSAGLTYEGFPELIIFSVSVPDFISSVENKNKAQEILIGKIMQINKLNASNIAITCNTAHVLLPELQKKSTIPFVSMIEEVARCVKKDRLTKVGLLSSPATVKFKLYQSILKKFRIETVVPEISQLNLLEEVIRGIISGKRIVRDKEITAKIADSLINRGAQGIILGCTELPLIFPKKFKAPIYNSSAILAVSLLEKYYEKT